MSDAQDLFRQINNAVLDLQAADLQSYDRPLKKLGRLLRHAELEPANAVLTEGLNLEAFIEAGRQTQGGMVGSAHLEWPDDDREALGLHLLMILRFSDDPDYMATIGHVFYYTGNKIMGDVNAVTSQLIIPFVRDYKAFVQSRGAVQIRLVLPLSRKVFIVHGHDGEARESVARYLSNVGFEPIILHEQANRGRTIIEKVEANADVGFAVVLLTADDVGRSKDDQKLEPRARQNVLLELGYFLARLGREKVCALKRGDVTIPSDFAGVVWESMDDAGAWKSKLARELQAAGHSIDWNVVMRR